MNTILNRTFVDETIVIDGNQFVNCTFINCVFIFAGGHYEFRGETFVNCTYEISGDALETTRFLKFVAKLNPGAPPVPPISGHMPDSQTVSHQ